MSRMAVPKLRFKDSEGREFPEWDKKGFAEIAVLLNGDRSDKYPKPQELFSEGIPFINAGNLKNGKVYPVDYITKDKYLSMGGAKLKSEDILFCLRGTVGKNAMFFENEGALASSLAAIRVNDENISTFWIQYMNSIEFSKKLSGLITGLAQPNLSGRDLMCLRVPVPSLPEQQKIADFLTTYDTMIDTQTQRVEAMKVRKKGLLQKIFSQEIRFKDEQGREYPEWIVQKLEELVSMHARIGWQNLRTSEFLNSGDYYLVTGTDFVNGKIDFSTCHYIGKERFEQDKKIQLDNDNILITKDGTLGKVAYVDILPKPTTLNAGIFCLKSKKQNINMKYLFQYLRGPFMMQYCNRHSTGGTIKHLNQGVLITFPVPLPSLSEQQKIADFLIAVDHQIEVEENRLERMQVIKKGLLQQMFI